MLHKLDRLISEHKRLSDLCGEILHIAFKAKLSEEILLCVIATATAGFLATDAASQTSAPQYYLYIAALAVMCAVWICCAFLCGFRRKWGFGAFAAAFWLLPQLFIYRADNVMTMAEYDKTVDIIGRASHLLVTDSIEAFCGTDARAAVIAAVVILIAAEIVMVLGMLLREQMRYLDFYCAFRGENPQYE